MRKETARAARRGGPYKVVRWFLGIRDTGRCPARTGTLYEMPRKFVGLPRAAARTALIDSRVSGPYGNAAYRS